MTDSKNLPRVKNSAEFCCGISYFVHYILELFLCMSALKLHE